MSSSKKVLLIAYTFPPATGIGGRRWAKFAKYLHRNGIDIKVIAAKNESAQISNWNSDISSIQDRITYLPIGFSKHLAIIPSTISEKIMYRLARIYAQLTQKGNYYDKSGQWVDMVLPLIEKEIKNGCKNIIVTCAPFIHSYHFTTIKEKYPEINYIVDFRDPWTNNKTAYGFSSLSKKRQEFEVLAEKTIANSADYIITVADNMTDYFKQLANGNSDSKFITLPNGFDKDDFQKKASKADNTGKLRFILTGTVYNKSLHLIKDLCDTLAQIKLSNPDIYTELQFDFYGNVPQQFFTLTKQHEVIQFKGQLKLKEVYTEINQSDICMLFLTDDLTFSFSTKFYEYIASNKPIAVFSSGGKTGDFIEKNKIGYALTPETMKDKLVEIYNHRKAKKLPSTEHLDISQFDIKKLTEKIIAILK